MSDDRDRTIAPADAITSFADLYPRQKTRFEWSVLSLKETDCNKAYTVNLRTLDCDCEAYEYDAEGADVCKHLAAALYESQKQIDMSDMGQWTLSTLLSDGREALRELQAYADHAEATAGDETAQSDSQAGESADADKAPDGPDPSAKAQQLQDAFDNVIDDMEVETGGGYVWFQTGYETPDEWPYPGFSETFEAVTSPDCVEFVHDGSPDWADRPHRLDDVRPGEWYKNAIAPEDVSTYIGEVLE